MIISTLWHHNLSCDHHNYHVIDHVLASLYFNSTRWMLGLMERAIHCWGISISIVKESGKKQIFRIHSIPYLRDVRPLKILDDVYTTVRSIILTVCLFWSYSSHPNNIAFLAVPAVFIFIFKSTYLLCEFTCNKKLNRNGIKLTCMYVRTYTAFALNFSD